ncbi:hypothetical protein [Pedobacter cryophilus]|uniref:Uncharacterized protein n=1 Tax=Pedobacter cryophilus TaxID=2571271 RepID=A0A4U1BX19_9SPHI|nr:hypothetical protein [Pedobacter cryophilus]TKB95746.1 hypothetical protein FA046_15760 [Pedobacter cryophilus]
MTLDEAKYNLSQKLTLLKSYLQEARIELINTDNKFLESSDFTFHGYSYVDAFINDIELDLMTEIKNLINLCHLNELNIEKRSLLVEIIIRDLKSNNCYLGFNDEENIKKLSEKQHGVIKKFRKAQDSLQKGIIKNLTDEYLTDSKFSRQKLQKIVWKGNQRELAELFERLIAKNWVEGLLPRQKEAFYRTIATLFEISGKDPQTIVNNFQDYNKRSYPYPLPVNGIFNCIQPNQMN